MITVEKRVIQTFSHFRESPLAGAEKVSMNFQSLPAGVLYRIPYCNKRAESITQRMGTEQLMLNRSLRRQRVFEKNLISNPSFSSPL